jgi:hypothetical protein
MKNFLRTSSLAAASLSLVALPALVGCALSPDAGSSHDDRSAVDEQRATARAAPTSNEPGRTPTNGTSASAALARDPVVTLDGRKFSLLTVDGDARARAVAPPAAQYHVMAARAHTIRTAMTPVKDQGPRNTCTSFASGALIERYTGGDVSEQCEVHDSGGEGGQVYYRVKDFLTKGLVDERLCTYYASGDYSVDFVRHVPDDRTYPELVARSTFVLTDIIEISNNPSDQNLVTFIENQIDAGNPVAFGTFYLDGAFGSNGYVTTPATPMCNGKPFATATDCAGHAMVITGYDEGTQFFEFKNSWGTGWGNDGGYGHMSFDYLRRFRAGPFVTLGYSAPRPNEAAIAGVYRDTLGRQPQSWEVDAWVTNVANGWTIPSMRAAFINNPQSADGIRAVYEGILYREPAQWEVDAWKQNLTAGWTIPNMRAAFKNDPQHTDAIVRVYQDVFGRTPAQWEVNVWLSNLSGTYWSIPTMRINFADDAQTRAAINFVYQAVLGRNGTPAEIDQYQLYIRDFGWTIPFLRSYLANPPGPIH